MERDRRHLEDQMSIESTPVDNASVIHPQSPRPKSEQGPMWQYPTKDIPMPSSESPARDPRGETPETRRPTTERACEECRHRKVKCDRAVPICVLCETHGRSCTHEKPNRTALTRRYLSQLETKLVRFRELVQQYLAQLEHENSTDFASSAERPRSVPRISVDLASFQQVQRSLEQELSGLPATPELQPQNYLPSRASYSMSLSPMGMKQVSTREGPQRLSSGGAASRAVDTLGSSLQTPSSQKVWTELPRATEGGRLGDGMASLTSDTNQGGHLGSAAGSSLLQVTDTSTADMDNTRSPHQEETTIAKSAPSIPFTLTSLGQLEPFVDVYFSLFHRSYPIVHEATFRAQFMEVVPRPNGNAWEVLLFALAAVGAMTVSSQPTGIDVTLFEAAKTRLSMDMIENGNISLVQALALCADYMQKRNKPNSGYIYMGLARRIAMGIGLHKELASCKANLFTMEMRRRIWSCLYIFDVGTITSFARSLDFPDKGFNVQLPMNVYDSDITMGTKLLPQPVNATTIYTHLRAQATFHMATSEIYTKIISTPFPSASELIELDDRVIGGWLTTLPSYFQEHVVQIPNFSLGHAVLRWRYRNFRILVYRPFLVRRLMMHPDRALPRESASQADIAIERCLNAARESVELISTFLDNDKRRMLACWYGQYFLLQAIAIPVICLRNDPKASRAVEWRDLIVQAMQVLESMAHLNPSSTPYLGIIRTLCGAYLDSSFDQWGPATEESPQTQLTNLYPLMWPISETAQMEEVDTDLQESTIMDFLSQLPAME